jgi:hypothetical protein
MMAHIELIESESAQSSSGNIHISVTEELIEDEEE